MRFMLLFAICAATAFLIPRVYQTTENCASSYTLCSPPGASSNSTPKIGDPNLQQLYVDLIHSSLPNGEKDVMVLVLSTVKDASLCCVSYLACLAMSNLSIPFCYDRFTTNYFLPDGSYGNVISGIYVSPSGDVANLISGEYTFANGTRGNIYSDNEAAKPNVSTLSLPEQYTGQGVGSAIPASILGAVLTETYITVLPGTTIQPSTIDGSTRSAEIVVETTLPANTLTITSAGFTKVSTISGTTISETSFSVTTIPTSTVYGITILGLTTTVTATVPATGQPTTAASTDRDGTESATAMTSAVSAATATVAAATTSILSVSSSLFVSLTSWAYMWILSVWVIIFYKLMFEID